MSPSPMTHLAAAKHVADCAGIPWPTVYRVYRDLQAAGLLPVASGRTQVPATAEATATLLMALAIHQTGTPAALPDNVLLFRVAGGQIEAEWLQTEFVRLLTDFDAAGAIESVVFETDAGRAIVSAAGVRTAYQADRAVPGLIQSRGTIAGQMFRKLQATVSWGLAA